MESKIKREIVLIESGTVNNWKYCKWSDGTAECWGSYGGTLGTSPTAVGGKGYYGYIWTGFSQNSFPPNLFATYPCCFVNVWYFGSGYFWGQARNTNASSFNLMSLTNQTTVPLSMSASVYAIGKWK